MAKADPKNRRHRWLVWGGITVGTVVVIVLLLPTIASYIIVPGMIRSAIQEQVKGTVDVSGTSFSWFGSQEIRAIKVTSTDDVTALDASVTVERSLLGLMFGWPDVGKVLVTASGKGMLHLDGSTSVSNLVVSSDSKEKSDGPALPAGLDVDLVLDVSSLEFVIENMNSSLVISGLQANAMVQAGGPIDLTLKTKVESGGKPGSLDLKFKLDRGVDSDGRLQLAGASLDGSVTGRSLHLPAAGQWVDIDTLDFTASAKALGDGLQVNGKASGTLQNSTPMSLQAKFDLGSIVTKDGGFTIGPDSISGSIDARSIPTSLLQPFLGDSPVQLVRDIGPQLNLSLEATSGSARSIHMEMDAQFIKAKADVTVDAERLSNGTMTIDMTMSNNVLAQAGIRPDGDLKVAVSGSGFGMKLGSEGQPELASLAGEFDITATGSLGSETTGALKLSGLTAKIMTQGLQEGVSVDAGGQFGGATLKATAKVSDLLVDGEIDAEHADLVSSISLTKFDLNLLEPFMGAGVPPGFLADASGGPVNLDVTMDRKQSVMTVVAKASAPELDGSADVKITESAIQVDGLNLTYKIEPATVDKFMPEPNTVGHLASQVTVNMTSRNFTYALGGDPDLPLGNRLDGKIQIAIDHVGFALVKPAETIVLQELMADATFSSQHALQVQVNAKVATDQKPLGSAQVDATVPNLDSPSIPNFNVELDLADTTAVASIAGIDPGPLAVLLGPSSQINLAISPPGSTDGAAKIVGTVTSPRATGQFQASVMGDMLESAKVDFTTKLVPGDLQKALGSNSHIRLGNNVTASVTFDAAGFSIAGAPITGAKATAKVTATSMQLTGEDGTTIVVDGTKGTAAVNGRDVNADFSASIVNRSGSAGNGRVKMTTSATLPQGDEVLQIGTTVLELDSVPTFIFELVGAEGRLAEAALGKTVDSKATITAAGVGRNSVKAQVTSPYTSLSMPQAWLEKGQFDVLADQKIQAQLKVSKELSGEILSVLHPIFADISTIQKPITLTVGPLTLPLSGDQTSKLNGTAVLDIGDVTLNSTNVGSQLLMFLGNTSGSSVPAHFSPLKVTATNGLIEYSDFTMEIGQGDGGGYKQKLIFDGKVDLASDPPEVIGISASFPATNLASAFGELQKVPSGLLATIRPKVTFYGPLYDAKGNRIPLKSKIDPLNLDEGLKPDQINGIIQGIGDLIRKKN